MPKEKNSVSLDPELYYRRMYHYREKSSGWEIFKALYWAIYIFAVGVFFLIAPQSLGMTVFIGFALVLLAMFYAIFGLVVSLHFKLMKRHS
jgi:hypothetical protein